MHVDGDVLGHDVLGEGDEVLGDAAQHFAGIGLSRVDVYQLEKERRRARNAILHGRGEEGLLRFEVPEDRGRRHAENGSDVGQRGAVETLLAEDAAGGLKQFVTRDPRWASHL